jgi:CRISPR-associated endonuclease/helicase Cas3
MLLNVLLSFWAKLGTATWPVQYHPVLCHLLDVAVVARNLWDSVFRRQIRQWVAERLQLDEDDCALWLAFWSGSHDIGKVCPCFQDRGKENTAELRRRLEPEFNFPSGNEHHGVLSTKILADELVRASQWPAIDPGMARNVGVAVGGHHGIFPTNWDGICGALGNEKWAIARRELLAVLARLIGLANRPRPSPRDDQSIWMFWLA